MTVERSYDYPAKNAVRSAWMHLLPDDLSHDDDWGLYLPAPENLELPGYLKKGIVSNRLLCPENDPNIFDAVRANAQGVHLISGSVADAVEEHVRLARPMLRFANLDFDGNQHTFIEELLALARILPGMKTSYLAVTSYAARDDSALLQGTINACKFFSSLPDVATFMQGYGQMMRRYRHLLRLIPRAASTPLAHMQRELGLLWWIVLMFGCVDTSDRYHHVDRLYIDQVIVEPLRVLTQNVEQQLAGLRSRTDMVFVFEPVLRTLLQNRKVEVWIDHIERYAYWSINRQPMRTWFFRIRPIERADTTMQDLLTQVWDLAVSNPLMYIDKSGSEVRIS